MRWASMHSRVQFFFFFGGGGCWIFWFPMCSPIKFSMGSQHLPQILNSTSLCPNILCRNIVLLELGKSIGGPILGVLCFYVLKFFLWANQKGSLQKSFRTWKTHPTISTSYVVFSQIWLNVIVMIATPKKLEKMKLLYTWIHSRHINVS